MRCPLCSFEFEPHPSTCSTSCPLGANCHMICCPNCGYQGVDEERSRLASWFGRLLRRSHAATPGPGAVVPMSAIPLAVDVQVERLVDMPPAREQRLLAYGLAPGAVVRVIQRSPAALVRVGETDLGLSTDVLDQIWIRFPDHAGDGSGSPAQGTLPG